MVVIPIIMIIMIIMIIIIITFSIIAKGVTTVSTQSTGTATKIVQNARCPVHQRDGGDHGGNEVTCNVIHTLDQIRISYIAYKLFKKNMMMILVG